MLYSKIFPKTRHESQKDAGSPGTDLLIRAGFIHKNSAGIWTWTNLGLSVRRKVEGIVREEMNNAGGLELEMPILQSRDYWEETGRWDKYLNEGMSFYITDRKEADYILAPTAEEMFTDYARSAIRSYKDLPVILWQMSPKFRDELRPRQGLVRGREFLMKDAYSFGRNEEDMLEAFKIMGEAYDSHSKNNYATIKTGATVTGGTVGAVGGPIGILAGLGLARFFASLATKWMKGRNKNQINKMENDLKTANQK